MSTRPSCIVAAAVLSIAALSAQTPQPPKPQPEQRPSQPTFRTEANFVRVDVYATAQGSPIKDLRLGDFRLLEDGVPQTISAFEHVDVRGNIAQEQRIEPNTIRQSQDALKNPRARVFVLFLDVHHVTVDGAWHVREPISRLLQRLLGEDDLIGIMTPGMSAADVVFARRTQVLEAGLRDHWPWGERHTLQRDQRERQYEMCYPWQQTKDVVAEMIGRRRERAALNALYDLVTWLRDQREERKAVLTVSEGWLLYRPNPDLTRPRIIDSQGRTEPVPGPDPIGVGPDGRLSKLGRSTNTGVPNSDCDAERLALSQIDNEYYFRDLMAAANRSNASFYTIDPRGLPVFDSPIGPEPPPRLEVDGARLRSRLDSLAVLANNTDGFAVLNSNNIEKGLRRISDDLTSYYLLGYYSTNTKLDGRYRNLKVVVNRPGVEIRARRGYKAATEAEVAAARSASAAPVPESRVTAQNAMSGLARLRPGAALSTHAIALQTTATIVWVAGELAQPAAVATSAAITVSAAGAAGSADVAIAAGERTFTASVPLTAVANAPIDIRVRLPAREGQLPLTDAVRIDPAAGISTPLMFRRGPATGNRPQPAGQPQFSRTERARFDTALAPGAALTSAQVLDRNGAATTIPVSLGERNDPSGQPWGTIDVVLAALAPGDYILEVAGTFEGKSQKVLTAFRVTR